MASLPTILPLLIVFPELDEVSFDEDYGLDFGVALDFLEGQHDVFVEEVVAVEDWLPGGNSYIGFVEE